MNSRAKQAERRFEKPMLVAAALVIPSLILDDSGLGHRWNVISVVLNWGIWLAFLAELVTMLLLVDDRRSYLRQHPIEVVTVLFTAPLLGSVLASVRALRLLRLLRLLRVAQLGRRAFTPDGLRDAAVLVLLAVLGAGEAFSQIEPSTSLGDGLYWAVTTVTTVGYGDELPTMTASKILAAGLMLVGVGFAGLLTGAIAERFVRSDVRQLAEAEATEDDALNRELTAIAARLGEISDGMRR